MAGAVFVSPTSSWSSSSWTFYWVVDTLADGVNSESLSAKLRAIAELPRIAADTLPESSGRESVVAQISELALLCEGADS
jgi:hypothetical protein